MELERRFPDRFIPRYSMVMFHPEIPYAEALRRGAVQEQILQELDQRRRLRGLYARTEADQRAATRTRSNVTNVISKALRSSAASCGCRSPPTGNNR